jgi:hypothetical protein
MALITKIIIHPMTNGMLNHYDKQATFEITFIDGPTIRQENSNSVRCYNIEPFIYSKAVGKLWSLDRPIGSGYYFYLSSTDDIENKNSDTLNIFIGGAGPWPCFSLLVKC